MNLEAVGEEGEEVGYDAFITEELSGILQRDSFGRAGQFNGELFELIALKHVRHNLDIPNLGPP